MTIRLSLKSCYRRRFSIWGTGQIIKLMKIKAGYESLCTMDPVWCVFYIYDLYRNEMEFFFLVGLWRILKSVLRSVFFFLFIFISFSFCPNYIYSPSQSILWSLFQYSAVLLPISPSSSVIYLQLLQQTLWHFLP